MREPRFDVAEAIAQVPIADRVTAQPTGDGRYSIVAIYSDRNGSDTVQLAQMIPEFSGNAWTLLAESEAADHLNRKTFSTPFEATPLVRRALRQDEKGTLDEIRRDAYQDDPWINVY